MNAFFVSPTLGLIISGFLLALGSALLLRSMWPVLTQGPVARSLSTYERELTRELIFLRAGVSARTFLILQSSIAGVGFALLPLSTATASVLVGLALMGRALLKNARKKRVERLEKQVEGWLTSMARCLEAAPSLGEALESTIATCDAPMRQEIEQLVSEMRLGRPLDQALFEWSDRVGSRTLTMAVATLLVGRETGGQIGAVLRSAAGALREMERLEGIVRTKTAEGKGQAWVISIVPFPLYFAVRTTDPTYFLPLEQTATGHLLLAIAAGLWIAAALSARKILAVQI